MTKLTLHNPTPPPGRPHPGRRPGLLRRTPARPLRPLRGTCWSCPGRSATTAWAPTARRAI